MAPMTPIPVSALLRDLVKNFRAILRRNLVGIYLYGSLTQKAFNPKRSDVDCIVVTRRALSATQFSKIGKWLVMAEQSNPWTARLQSTFLLRDELFTMNSKACLYQFGQFKRSTSDGNPIVWMNVLESGVVLCGQRPASFVPRITPGIIFEALERELGYLREEICEKPKSEWRDVPLYRAYAVLTLCRIMYTFKKGTVVSKPRAAKWVINHHPGPWNKTILRALENKAYTRSGLIPLSQIVRFIDFADAQLRDTVVPQASESCTFR
ncbi:MAG: aminoglycoside adenylyltransferase domain-containing protein [Candidatus Binataceae bacterium]